MLEKMYIRTNNFKLNIFINKIFYNITLHLVYVINN